MQNKTFIIHLLIYLLANVQYSVEFHYLFKIIKESPGYYIHT